MIITQDQEDVLDFPTSCSKPCTSFNLTFLKISSKKRHEIHFDLIEICFENIFFIKTLIVYPSLVFDVHSSNYCQLLQQLGLSGLQVPCCLVWEGQLERRQNPPCWRHRYWSVLRPRLVRIPAPTGGEQMCLDFYL